MEMKQSTERLHSLSKQIQTSYQKFFLLNQANVSPKPQMPQRQIALFLKQSYSKNLLITIQFNQNNFQNQVSLLSGYLKKHPLNEQYILNDIHTNLVKVINPSEIRYLEQ